ncbi:MAG TPA: DNA mismatch repair endonuclease MutL [Candidatus Babeliales bacterium]|nr:DNA mismatch repair endonuclease MutL [Candidatus Babeliales bacterium]
MAKIKQLSSHEAQKIAAGEVVERPANIVKELVENSIDARATRITIYIEDGGKKLIRIVDNGCGMDQTDAQICFDRHATSKITHVHQLEHINTFGFRGEALASIASVSAITLITKEEQSLEGTKIVIDANKITEVQTVACNTGTDISIQNLFYNVPARKKFLKTTATEWRSIQLLFNAFCFDYPHIHFLLFCEGKQVHNCPPVTDIKNRALQIWQDSIHTHLLELHVEEPSFSISGIISDHQHYRYDRSSMYVFVNNRWIKNQHLTSAFIKGYANVLAHGRYPAAVIHIQIPSHEVDINIHPRKEEVKFLHPRKIEQALQQMVKAALEKNLSQHLMKEVTFKSAPVFTPNRDFNSFDFDTFVKKQNDTFSTLPFDTPATQALRASGMENLENTFAIKLDKKSEENTKTQVNISHDKQTLDINSQKSLSPFTIDIPLPLALSAPEGSVSKGADFYRLIGQYNTTYILVEKEDGLFLVDQHAAHERILYELFSERFADVATVQLLFPHIITLSSSDINLITPHLDIFITNGIMIEQCASDQLIIQSLPVHLKDQSMNDTIKEVIAWILDPTSLYELRRAGNANDDMQEIKKLLNNKLQAQMACKAAVKAGDILTQEKMQQLLDDLQKTANRFSCPHGRPTGWLLSLHEIEKKFKRRI